MPYVDRFSQNFLLARWSVSYLLMYTWHTLLHYPAWCECRVWLGRCSACGLMIELRHFIRFDKIVLGNALWLSLDISTLLGVVWSECVRLRILLITNFKGTFWSTNWHPVCHGSLTKYGKLRTFFPPPRVSDPGMHRSTCRTVSCDISDRENVPSIPGNLAYLVRGPLSMIL